MVFFKVSTIAVLNSSLEAAAQSLIGGTQGCSGKQPKSSGASKHSLAMAAMVAISNLAHNIKHTPSRNLGKVVKIGQNRKARQRNTKYATFAGMGI